MYIDLDVYTTFIKVIYDRSGEYWKTCVASWVYSELEDGTTDLDNVDIRSESNSREDINRLYEEINFINSIQG